MSATPRTSIKLAQVPINITHRDGLPPTVDNDSIVIDREQGGEDVEIVWVCNSTDKDFYICFSAESPFQQRHFHRGNSRSGSIKAGASGRYKYNIEIDGHILDPQVIVRP
jgi:hypothetical protein